MAYTLNANFIKAMSGANIEPVVHCSIALSGTTMDFHNSVESLDSSVTGDALLSDVTSVAQEVDPITREVKHGEITLVLLDDGKIRSLVSSQNFIDKTVTIKLGATSLVLSDFVGIFRGPIVSIIPEPGSIIIKVRSFTNQVKGVKTFRTYVAEHPFTVVKQMLEDCGVASADIDTASFTPSNHTDISHYAYSSFVFYDNDMTLPPALSGVNIPETGILGRYAQEVIVEEYISEVMRMTRSTLITDPGTGDVKIVRYDSSGSTVKHFTVDDYRDFSQEDSGLPIITEVKTRFAKVSSTDLLIQEDSTASTAFGASDYSNNVKYLSASAVHAPSNLEDSSTNYVGFVTDGGQCGTREITSASQPADAKISAARPYFAIYRTEILKSTTAFSDSTVTAQEINYPARDHDGNVTGTIQSTGLGLVTTLVSRPFAGTEADGGESTGIGQKSSLDCTMAFDYGTYLLERFSNTCPKVKISTGLECMNVEIGDLISIDSDLFLSTELGLNGLDSSTKFEVTKKEVTPVGDSVGIDFEFSYATTSGAPSVTVTSKPPQAVSTTPGRLPKSSLIAASSGSFNNAVVDNREQTFSVTTTSGLGISVSGGCAMGSGTLIDSGGAVALTMEASKHTYIGVNLYTGGITKNTVATTAEEPELSLGEVRLAKVITDGSSVTSIVDRRDFGAISVAQLDKKALAPGRQLIWNNGFGIYPNNGDIPPGWDFTTSTPGTDFVKNDSVVYDGRYAVKTLGTSTVVRIFSEKIPVDKNRVYRASAFYRQAAAMNMRLFVFWWKADFTAASTSSSTIFNANLTSTGAWQNITGVVTPPSDAIYGSLDLNSANSGVSYFNNADLVVEPFSFSASRTSSDFTPSSSGDAVEFNNELHDFGGVYNTGTGQFTVPVSGTYTFSTNLSFDATVGARTVAVSVVASTSGTLASSYVENAINGSTDENNVAISMNVAAASLVKGENVEIQVTYGGTAPVVRHSYSFFSGREIT